MSRIINILSHIFNKIRLCLQWKVNWPRFEVKTILNSCYISNLDSVYAFQLHEDYYTTLNEAIDASNDQHRVDLDAITQLHLIEFSKIAKTGGINIPYVAMEWLGIQIPQAVISNLDEKPVKFIFSTVKESREEHYLSPLTRETQPDEDSTSPRIRH